MIFHEKTQVIVVGSSRLERECLAELIAGNLHAEFVVECIASEELASLGLHGKKNIILFGVNFPLFSAIDSTRDMRLQFSSAMLIAILPQANPFVAKKLMTSGARACITRNTIKEEMIECIVEVAGGKKFISKEIKEQMFQQALYGKSEEGGKEAFLSRREEEIIGLIQDGMTSKEIAGVLSISYRTVQVHRHRIFKKLQIKNAASLVLYTDMNLDISYRLSEKLLGQSG